jgi:hypothetical protein
MNRSTRFVRWTAYALAVASTTLPVLPANAFRMVGPRPTYNEVPCDYPGGFFHRTTSNTNWFHNQAGQGAGKAAQLFNAMNVWTFLTNTSHSLTYSGTTTAGFALDNVNTISWGPMIADCPGCLAVTRYFAEGGLAILEADILFGNALSWTTNGNNFDTWTVAAHELGHSLGIHHTNVGAPYFFFYPTMRASYFGVSGRTLEGDDRAALACAQSRYPPSLSCVPNGGVDDTLGGTSCCSGIAVSGSTYCTNPSDLFTCHQICATPPTGGCIPSGGIDDTLNSTRCCSGAAVPGSTRCLNPADFNNGWKTCIHTCA